VKEEKMVFVPFKGQCFESLKSQYNENNLFEDPLFPASEKSLYYSQRCPSGVVWRRPKQVRPNAEFVVDGFSRCDMDQGYVGNCWFIAGKLTDGLSIL
jgi:calpain